MKPLIIACCAFLSIALNSISQDKFDVDIKTTDKLTLSFFNKSGSEKFIPGQELKVVDIFDAFDGYAYIVEYNSERYSLPFKQMDKIEYLPASDLAQEWQIQMVRYGVAANLVSKGMQYDLRRDLDEDALDFIYAMESNNFIFKDDFLEDYLQNLVHRIHPGTLPDGRPGVINVRVVKNQNPNAYSFSNGSIFITTGLLSVINSEEELIGVLAHEVAHFVLDHAVTNINRQIDAEIKRQQRAEFWSGVAAALGAAAEVFLATQHDLYFGGNLATSAAVVAYSVASEVSDRMGINYEIEQEKVADATSEAVLKYLSLPPGAYASALRKIADYQNKSGNYYALMASATHPALNTRISPGYESDTASYYSNEYHAIISFVTTFNAALEFNDKHYSACENLVDRNIQAGLAVEEDYILKAMVTRILYNSVEKNLEAIDYLRIAKDLNVVPNLSVYKQEGITYLRLNQKAKASESFSAYLDELYQQIEAEKEFYTKGININNYQYWSEEINWTKKMIYKADKL